MAAAAAWIALVSTTAIVDAPRADLKSAIRLGSRTCRCGWPPSSHPARDGAARRRGARRGGRELRRRHGRATAWRRATARPPPAPAYPLADVTLLAPVPRPRAIFGIGRNYAAHAAELGNELPEKPMVFMKLPTSSVPPSGPVRCPAVVAGARLRGRAGRGDRRRTAGSAAGRSATTSAPATSSAARSSGRAPRASTPRARGGRGSRPPTSCPTRSACGSAHGSTASSARTRTPTS